MVKLVDTPASGAGDLTVVEVRVFFWAPILYKNPRKRVFAFLGFHSFQWTYRQTKYVPAPAHLRTHIVYNCFKNSKHCRKDNCE
jgi:hypothetical protein